MKNTTAQDNAKIRTLTINLPGDIYANLERIAHFNDTTADALAYSYIVDSVTNDSRIAKRMEFEEHLSEALDKEEEADKDRDELLNDSKLLY